MIDTNDKATQALDLGEQPKRRGRPATGSAMSNADRQRAYRERQKAQRNENMHKRVAEDLRAELAKALEEIEFLSGKNTELLKQLRRQKDQLEQRNKNSENHQVPYDEVVAIAQELGERCKKAEARVKELEKELEKARMRAKTAGPTKRRYVLQFRYEKAEGVEWIDDKTGDYGTKREAEKACKRMNEPGTSETVWRVRERQWV